MRPLTLQEKISIKGALSRYGVPSLVSLDMEQAIWFFHRCTGRSVKFFYLYQRSH
jgi:hypothetical protein